jgi:hypothetical protein
MLTRLLSSPPPRLAPAPGGAFLAKWSWRLGWLALALLLLVAVPLHVCMPLFSDVIQYDISARVALKGGIPYRDVFDTNLPGMVWVHMAVRSLFGWSSEAFRLTDLAVVSAIIGLLVNWLRVLGRSAATQVWAAVLLYAFYFSTSEWVHCQRDTWMLLPCLIALELRRRQVERLLAPTPPAWQVAGGAFVEGLFWGMAFWIKPFVAVPGVLCWLLGSILVWRTHARGSWQRLGLDTAGLLGGGLVVGALGVLWLVQSGTWPWFWGTMTGLNRDYFAASRTFPPVERFLNLLTHFFPWDLVWLAVVPLCLLTLARALLTPGKRWATTPALARPLLLSGFYLGWWLQTALLQFPHEYVLAPVVLLGWAVFLALLPGVKPAFLGRGIVLVLLLLALVWHPLGRWERFSLWGRCWREGGSLDLRNQLQLTKMTHTPDWVHLEEVADFLRGQDLQDGELTCFTPSAESLYLDLDLRPSTPFVQFEFVLTFFPDRLQEVCRQLNESPQRFVVTDLRYPAVRTGKVWEESADPLALPPNFPKDWKQVYPWSEPIVFHSGRYLVHRVTAPVQRLR